MRMGSMVAVAALASVVFGGARSAADPVTPPTIPARARPVAPGWTDHVVATADGGFLMGNPNAPVKLIEYGSRTCPACGRFAREGEPLLKAKYVASGKLCYEFHDFPIHAPDLAAILLGQCNGPRPFFPMLEAMYAEQSRTLDTWAKLPVSAAAEFAGKSPTDQAAIWGEKLGYTRFAVQHGVPAAKARACLADARAVDALEKHIEAGVAKYGINQTPFFIINGRAATGVSDWATLEPMLRAAGT